MAAVVEKDIPQWKKDLIARLKNQNKTVATVGSVDEQLYSSPQYPSCRAGHQPSITCSKTESVTSGASCLSVSTNDQCDVKSACLSTENTKMVQERVRVDSNFVEMVNENNGYHKSDIDSDSSEDLHYGPGIVKKLKNKYLSLALRENPSRPSLLHMRKATSLENLLDDDIQDLKTGHFQARLNDTARSAPNRYRNAGRHGHEMKRARSVEAISRIENVSVMTNEVVRPNRQSLHEEMLIARGKEGNDPPHRKAVNDKEIIKPESKIASYRINRPKRIQPVMNEKEKPPADVVKQAKMIFERRPEQRTRAPPQTGDVAAKVDCFNNIIVKAKVDAKVAKKPPIKTNKPVLNDKFKSNTHRPVAKSVVITEEKSKQTRQLKSLELNKVTKTELHSPIPDVSRIDHIKTETDNGIVISNLSQTPDLIPTSSPLPMMPSPTLKKTSTEEFIKQEIRSSSLNSDFKKHSPVTSPKKLSSPLLSPNSVKPASPLSSPSLNKPSSPVASVRTSYVVDLHSPGCKIASPTSINNFFVTNKKENQGHLPSNDVSNLKTTPPTQQLKIDVNGHGEPRVSSSSPKLLMQTQRSPPLSPFSKSQIPLTPTEIEKNSINIAKTEEKILQQQRPNTSSALLVKDSVEVVNKNVLPKKSRTKEPVSNTAVFNFTSRKDVPDYISNDRSRTPSRPEMPKPGEGGIILLPDAIDSFVDEDEEILRSLECPPSPCDVTFINDNILIDGKSSLSQRTKQAKMRISFIDGPEIYEYPSESSLLVDDFPLSPVQLGHTVPNMTGSSLANYTPKSTEEFEPGVTRSVQQTIIVPNKSSDSTVEPVPELVEDAKPFSSGNNADILF